MTKITEPIAVTSRSFSKHKILRTELLQQFSNVKFNDEGLSLAGDGLVDFLRGSSRAIIALEKLDDAVLSKLPELKIVAKYGVGLDSLDLKSFQKRGIQLGWTGGVNRRSVSELTLAFALSLLRHIPRVHAEVRSGSWKQTFGNLLSEKTVGIVGIGHIGKDLVQLLKPFGCKLLLNDIIDISKFCGENSAISMDLSSLLQESDVVTLHVPLTPKTQMMIDREKLSLMKPSAVLINAARGGLIDEVALKEALIQGKLGGAAFDVFRIEPPEDTELLKLPNFLCTPHIGGSAAEAVLAMGRAAIAGLKQHYPVEHYEVTP